jgi:AraC-like DNA-binding protein
LQQVVNGTKFELARQLLKNTGLSVTQIAAVLKYADASVFSRAFRIWANLGPTEWRTLHGEIGGGPTMPTAFNRRDADLGACDD